MLDRARGEGEVHVCVIPLLNERADVYSSEHLLAA